LKQARRDSAEKGATMGAAEELGELDASIARRIDEVVARKVEERLAQLGPKGPPSMTIIATKGTLDWAYPPFILASTGAALGWDVSVFFTFYGLNLLRRDLSTLKVSPLGNPGMPMKMPFGPQWFRNIDWNIPNAVQAIAPGFESLATALMRRTIRDKGVADVAELRAACIENGVKLIACQMTVDLFGFSQSDFIAEVSDFCGASTFLPTAQKADVSLFI
jgi:peroxiredoxin family protein